MKFINFFSSFAMPFMIIIIVIYGVIERKKVFDIFLDGAKEGIEIVTNLLMLDPKKRPTCEELLEKEYFKKDIANADELKKIMELK